MVKRVVHLGFEVRIELELTGGEPARGAADAGQNEELELAPGDIVFVRPPADPTCPAIPRTRRRPPRRRRPEAKRVTQRPPRDGFSA